MGYKNTDSSILNKYIKNKEDFIHSLDNNINKLKNDIEVKKEEISKNKVLLEQIKFKKSLLQDKYKSLLRILKQRGCMIYIKNNDYNLSEWENLYIRKERNNYGIISKNGSILSELDDRLVKIFNKEIDENKYSLIIIRIEGKNIKIKFSIIYDK